MTQFQHTLKALLEGRKTETSRIALPEPDGTGTFDCEAIRYPLGVSAVQRYLPGWGKWRTVWETGKDYAIVPRRGVHSVGRYRVEAIWRQDVRTLTLGQVEAEGFSDELWVGFWWTWCSMHDRVKWDEFVTPDGFPRSGTEVKQMLMERPSERYQAWRMTIRVLWETVDWDAPAVCALQIEPKLS
jgi:hypothetical protein